MTTVSPSSTDPMPEACGVASARPTDRHSLTRKNRWKRRGTSKLQRNAMVGCGLLCFVILVVVGLRFGTGEAATGPDGPFATAVFEAFPEADPARIETAEEGGLPSAATLHLPAHLIEPDQGIGDPFARLGAEFGGTERSLSGTELAARIERIAGDMLPADMPRCHTYDVGSAVPAEDGRYATRALYIRLGPGC